MKKIYVTNKYITIDKCIKKALSVLRSYMITPSVLSCKDNSTDNIDGWGRVYEQYTAEIEIKSDELDNFSFAMNELSEYLDLYIVIEDEGTRWYMWEYLQNVFGRTY